MSNTYKVEMSPVLAEKLVDVMLAFNQKQIEAYQETLLAKVEPVEFVWTHSEEAEAELQETVRTAFNKIAARNPDSVRVYPRRWRGRSRQPSALMKMGVTDLDIHQELVRIFNEKGRVFTSELRDHFGVGHHCMEKRLNKMGDKHPCISGYMFHYLEPMIHKGKPQTKQLAFDHNECMCEEFGPLN